MFWQNLPNKNKVEKPKTSRYFQIKKLNSGSWSLLATISGGSHLSAYSLVNYITEVAVKHDLKLEDLYITTVDTPDGENNG